MASAACPAVLRLTALTPPALSGEREGPHTGAVMRIPSVHIARPEVESVVFGPGIFTCLADFPALHLASSWIVEKLLTSWSIRSKPEIVNDLL